MIEFDNDAWEEMQAEEKINEEMEIESSRNIFDLLDDLKKQIDHFDASMKSLGESK